VAAGQPVSGGATDEALGRRLVATAPAVGFYQPRHGLVAGSRLRAGERLGIVDVLGVPQDVPAPDDGILGALLVEAGEPVEYGQDIAVIELLPAAVPAPGSAPASMPVGELVQAEVRP
jgi:biotin carboxyl carrier protein